MQWLLCGGQGQLNSIAHRKVLNENIDFTPIGPGSNSACSGIVSQVSQLPNQCRKIGCERSDAKVGE